MNIDQLKSWIGRREIVADDVPMFPARALAATLDQQVAPADGLPPLWHWIYFLNIHRQSEIAEDGHARRGGFIPPVPLPRRMFAGAQIAFHRPVLLSRRAVRESTIEDLTVKQGRTGQLVFLKIRVDIRDDDGTAMTEHQDIVYRETPRAGAAAVPLRPRYAPDWTEAIHPSYPLLFRYSSLIFNAHRIHLDRGYAMNHEGYGGLVVHGQLVATLLAELARKHVDEPMTAFRFKAIRPILDTGPFSIFGARARRSVHLWAEDAPGSVAMEAEASYGASTES
jgi:3-methylfumaryl-CoA hydratase